MLIDFLDKTTITAVDPEFWNNSHEHQIILNYLLQHFPRGGVIQGKEFKALESWLSSHELFKKPKEDPNHKGVSDLDNNARKTKKLKKNPESCLRNVLSHLNDHGFLQADLRAKKFPIPRPSHLPPKGEEFALLPVIKDMHVFLWKQWLATPNLGQDALLYAFTQSLITDAGISNPAFTWIVTQLRYSHILTPDMLQIPFLDSDPDGSTTDIYLPHTSALLANALLNRFGQQNSDDLVFLPEIQDNAERKKSIRKFLKRQFKLFSNDFAEQFPSLQLPNYHQFLRVGGLLTILEYHLEPLFREVSSQLPLPTAHPGHAGNAVSFDDFSKKQSDFARHTLRQTSPRLQTKAYSVDLDIDEEVLIEKRANRYSNWSADARAQIRSLNVELNEITKDNKTRQLNTSDEIAKAHRIIDKHLLKADKLASSRKSALHLALFWAKSLIKVDNTRGNLTPGTIADYLSRVFGARLLGHADSYDLSIWEPEEHEAVANDYFERDDVKDSTLSGIMSVYIRVYRFAAKHGFCQDVDIGRVVKETFAGSQRAQLINPTYFDRYLASFDVNKREQMILKIASILGYYGGLRAHELNMLKLDNIILDGGELQVEIHDSKTIAGKRRVILHLLAPPDICEWVRVWWRQRRDEFGENVNMAKIHLFGLYKKRDRYSRNNLVDVVISKLKHHFNDEDIVFHSLRHNFASWVLLRWYALRYPEVLYQLPDYEHRLFSHDQQRKFAMLFCLKPGKKYDDTKPNDLVVISKLMGHLGQKTLFKFYVHSFHILQKHAMERVSKQLNYKLTGKVIANLGKKLASQTTQKNNLNGHTVNDVLSYLEKSNDL